MRRTTTMNSSNSKADFIRENADLKPAAIVAKAKEAGLEVAPSYVYTVLSTLRNQNTRKRANGKPSEADFVELGCEIGITRAISLLQKARGSLLRVSETAA